MTANKIIEDIKALQAELVEKWSRENSEFDPFNLPSYELKRVVLDIEIRHGFLSLFSVYFNDHAAPGNTMIPLDVAEDRAARMFDAYTYDPYFTTRIVRTFRKAK